MTKQKIAILSLVLSGLLVSACSVRLYGFHTTFDQGLALFNQGQFEAAIPYFRRASEQDPNDAQAYLYLGRAHLSTRRWREAIQPLRTAFRLSPDESKYEVLNLLLDAMFAAAAGTLGPDRPDRPLEFKETL